MSRNLYECRGCGMLSTERHEKCPACGSKHGANGRHGTAFRIVDAAEFLDVLGG